jgi:hypothetical protein
MIKLALYKIKKVLYRFKKSIYYTLRDRSADIPPKIVEYETYSIAKLYDKELTIEAGDMYPQTMPNIVNIGLVDNKLNIVLPNRSARIYSDVQLLPGYSMIFKENLVEIPKLNKKLIGLKSLIAEKRKSLTSEEFIIEKIERKEFRSKAALSLMGHFSHHFGHFLLEYMERLVYLDKLEVNICDVQVIVKEDLDAYVKEILEGYREKLGFEILMVPADSIIYCEKLIDVDPCVLVCDTAKYASITDKLFYPSFKEFYKEYQVPSKQGSGTKLFLTRRGLRSLVNVEEVEQYFKAQGYEIIDNCHELTLNQKKEMFGNASYIVGPAGSALFNCIWCPSDVKILALINYEIAYDNVLQNMLSEEAEIYHIAGKEINYQFYNSDFHIDLKEIIHYSTQLGFTS